MDRLKATSKVVICLLLFLLVVGSSCPVCYAADPIRKLGRGITNIATGWAEFPAEIFRETDREGDTAGIFAAPFKGLAKAIARTAVGVYEVVTFLIPLPRFYNPVIEPEFIF